MNKLQEVFGTTKPILSVLHLKGDTDEEVLERAKRELDVYVDGGIDGIIVENYFGNYYQMRQVLDYIKAERPDVCFGVNCLNLDVMGFELAIEYGAKFIQLDSVAGHVKPRDDYSFEAFINEYRSRTKALILGGVRFKYQPYLSARSLEQDLTIGMTRCDTIVVTQDSTGQETSMEKIMEFRNILGDFPLIIGAGITPKNCIEQLKIGDGAIVGSFFKDTYTDTGDVDPRHVEELMRVIKNSEELV